MVFFAKADPNDLSDADLVRVFYSKDNFARKRRAEELGEAKGMNMFEVALSYVINPAINKLVGKVVVADALSSSTIASMLSLIGSSATGCHIMKTGATSIKRYSMELGGNAPVLVFADANLDLAADIVCAVKFGNSGQICVTPNRVFVEASVSDLFSQKVVACACCEGRLCERCSD